MRNRSTLLAFALALTAMSAIASAQDRHDRDRGGNRDQRDRGRDDRRPVDSHNHYRDGSPAVSISVVTPNVSVSWGDHNYRSGYYHRDPRWRDSQFLFRFYAYDYDARATAFSPFYYYPSMPGYVSTRNVDFRVTPVSDRYDQRISWGRRGSEDQVERDLKDAIYDLQDGVEKNDSRALNRIIVPGVRVNVFPNIGRPYRMDGDAFYNMFRDMVSVTPNSEYRVTLVESARDRARVTVEHDFSDPWGKRKVMFQRLTFLADRSGYHVAQFETSTRHF